MDIQKAAYAFHMEGRPVSCAPFGNGHINQTYMITTSTGRSVFVKKTGANAGNSPWWLRTIGQGSNSAVYVKEDGNILFKGIDVDYYSNGVRPVMWVNLDALD